MNHHNVLFLFFACLPTHFVALSGRTSHTCKESCASSTLHYTHKRFRIYLLTFNLGGRSNRAILKDILFDVNVKPKPDMYAIAFEEVSKKQIAQHALKKISPSKKTHLDELDDLMKAHNYYHVDKATKFGFSTQLIVYAANEHQEQISNPEPHSMSFGLSNSLTNIKSSNVLRFTFNLDSQTKSHLCIIGAHFDAHEQKSNYLDRIKNFQTTMKNIKFSSEPFKIQEHDVVLFMGDLNFRLSGIDRDEILNLIGEKKWPDLLKHDELKKAQIADETVFKAFEDFKEADIDFAPTFKFATHKTTGEQLPNYEEEKLRKPSYTDRILAQDLKCDRREKNLATWTLSSYHAFEPSANLRIYSDHRPVRAIYEATLGAITRVKARNANYGNRESIVLERPPT